MRDNLIGEGLRTVREEILKQDWPDDPNLQLLIEVIFYAGVTWAMHVIDEEGSTPEVLAQINDEIRAHAAKARAIKQALEGATDV